MNFRIDANLGCNITLVFDNLDLARVSRDKIRASLGQATFMDTPDLLVIMISPGVVIQIVERRIIVADQTQSAPGQVDLWSPAVAVNSAISESKVVAYGFNYVAGIALPEAIDARAFLTSLFLPTASDLQELLQVQNLSAIPRLIYMRNSVQYDLRLETADGTKLVAHLNAHFADKPLPDKEILGQSFVSEFSEMTRILGAI